MAASLTPVSMTDEEIFTLLKDFLEDITGEGDSITQDTLLIDDLGLDSLGFLDLFFTIQTSIQREVTNEQMRQLIAEELGVDRSAEFQALSDGEKDRQLYPRLTVRSFVRIIRRQLDGGISGVDLEKETDRILGSEAVRQVLGDGFEGLKEARIEQYLKDRKVEDPRLIQAVRDAFEEVTPQKVSELMKDKRVAQNIMQSFLKRHLNRTPEEFRQSLQEGKDFKISDKDVSEQFFESMQKEPERMGEFLLNEPVVQELIVREIIETRVEDIFESEMQRQARELNSEELSQFVRDNFFTAEFKAESIQKYVDPNHAHADLIQEVMNDNFDEIVQKEMRRILENTELRNQLVQDYIRENFDPVEAMELNRPEKMRELQHKITQKYINENMDGIMNRYMEEYLDIYGNTMLESMPEEEDIEVEGDVQDEFMKKFVDQMQMSDDATLKKPEQEIEEMIRIYQIEDPLMLSFMETNFEEMKCFFDFFEHMIFNEERMLQKVLQSFGLEAALYIYSRFDQFQGSRRIRQDFTRQFLNEHFEELMEISIRQQFLTEAKDIFDSQDEERFRKLLEDLVLVRMQEEIDGIEEKTRHQGVFEGVVRALEQSHFSLLNSRILTDEQARWFIGLLKDHAEELSLKSEAVQKEMMERVRPQLLHLMTEDLNKSRKIRALDKDRKSGIAEAVLNEILKLEGLKLQFSLLHRLSQDPGIMDRFEEGLSVIPEDSSELARAFVASIKEQA